MKEKQEDRKLGLRSMEMANTVVVKGNRKGRIQMVGQGWGETKGTEICWVKREGEKRFTIKEYTKL